jgi:hypothetical protein
MTQPIPGSPVPHPMPVPGPPRPTKTLRRPLSLVAFLATATVWVGLVFAAMATPAWLPAEPTVGTVAADVAPAAGKLAELYGLLDGAELDGAR